MWLNKSRSNRSNGSKNKSEMEGFQGSFRPRTLVSYSIAVRRLDIIFAHAAITAFLMFKKAAECIA